MRAAVGRGLSLSGESWSVVGLVAPCEVTAEVRTEVGCGSEPGLRQAVLLGQGTHCPGVQWAPLQPWAEAPCPRLRRWLRAQPQGGHVKGRCCLGGGVGVPGPPVHTDVSEAGLRLARCQPRPAAGGSCAEHTPVVLTRGVEGVVRDEFVLELAGVP